MGSSHFQKMKFDLDKCFSNSKTAILVFSFRDKFIHHSIVVTKILMCLCLGYSRILLVQMHWIGTYLLN